MNNSPMGTLFKYTSPNLEPIPQPPSRLGSQHCRPLSICPNHPGQIADNWGRSYAPELIELIQIAHLKPADPARLVPSCRDHNEGSCPQSCPLPLPSNWPWCFSMCPLPPCAIIINLFDPEPLMLASFPSLSCPPPLLPPLSYHCFLGSPPLVSWVSASAGAQEGSFKLRLEGH